MATNRVGKRSPSTGARSVRDRVERDLDLWRQFLRAEETRLGELRVPAAVVTLGLARARDRERALAELDELLRPTDRVGVLCEDELSILLAPLTDIHDAQRVVHRLAEGLRGAGIDLHLGWAMRHAGHGLFNAMARADAAMLTARGHGHLSLDLSDRRAGDA